MLAALALSTVGAAVMSASDDSSHKSASTVIPRPIEEALSIVASFRGAGPLTVDTNAGSVASDGWASMPEGPNSGVSRHWSLLASDGSGPVLLSVNILDDGTEAVDAWVPGASQANSWTLSTTNASPSTAHHVTVSGTTWSTATWTLSHTSSNAK